MIRPATADDAAAICDIYNHYVATTVVSFEGAPVAIAEMARRIAETLPTHPWYVAQEEGTLAGYAYASPWRARAAYRFAVETTVYLAHDRHRGGIGTTLYDVLLRDLAERGFHCAMGGIALPNPASVALHEKMGFVKVAHFREVGRKFGRRIDVGYWQKML